ncbi:MAG: RNA polymerase sigma-70 factor [Mangrovibacterium sp.]
MAGSEYKNLLHFEKDVDVSSFEKLFRVHYYRMKRYAFYFLKDEEEANDLIQDVFMQFWSKRETFDQQKNETAYLFKILKNRCLNLLKRKVIEGKYSQYQSSFDTERLYYISFDQTADFISMEDRISLELESIIHNMPDKCGQAFRLRWLEGKKIKDIAMIMNISTTMVDKHLTKGMEIARQKIKPELLILLFTIVSRF